jgi:hypothetical protein
MECAAFFLLAAEQYMGEADHCFAVQGMRSTPGIFLSILCYDDQI